MCELTHAGTFIGHRVHVLCHRVPGGHPHTALATKIRYIWWLKEQFKRGEKNLCYMWQISGQSKSYKVCQS